MMWEQKLHAMQSLAGSFTPSLLKMLSPGNWLCSIPGEIGGDGMLRSPCCAGTTPEAAVGEAWREAVTELPEAHHLAVSAGGHRRRYRWAGFMWVEIPQ